jgi:hypothetical protein
MHTQGRVGKPSSLMLMNKHESKKQAKTKERQLPSSNFFSECPRRGEGETEGGVNFGGGGGGYNGRYVP